MFLMVDVYEIVQYMKKNFLKLIDTRNIFPKEMYLRKLILIRTLVRSHCVFVFFSSSKEFIYFQNCFS